MDRKEERAALMARVLELADGTRSKREIAGQVGVSEGTLQVVLSALAMTGKAPKLTRGPINPKAISGESDLQTVLTRRDEVFDGTRSHQEIAEYLGIKRDTVRIASAIMHMAGIEMKAKPAESKTPLAEASLLAGGSVKEACAASGLSVHTVQVLQSRLRAEGKLKKSTGATGTMVIDEMYPTGASHKAMAEASGLSMSSIASIISRRIKKGILKMRDQGGHAQRSKSPGKRRERSSEFIIDQVNEAARYAHLGLTNFEITEKMNLTMIQVQCRMTAARKLGLVPNKKRGVCSACRRPGHNSRTCSNVEA